MNSGDREFAQRLLATFLEEAREHIDAMASGLTGLEHADADTIAELVELVHREAHSLKGAARSVGKRAVERVCQALEAVFGAMKQGSLSLDQGRLVPQLLGVVDRLNHLIDPEPGIDVFHNADQLVQRLEAVRNGEVDVEQDGGGNGPLWEAEPGAAGERLVAESATVRVPTARLDAVLLEAEGLLTAKLRAEQRAEELRELNAMIRGWENKRVQTRAGMRALQSWVEPTGTGEGGRRSVSVVKRLLEHLEAESELLPSIRAKTQRLARAARNDEHVFGAMTDNLLDDIKTVLMLPCAALLDGLARVARELARDQGKDVEIITRGGELTMDKRVIDEIKGALVHLVRNAVDHGIEKPAERVRLHKSPRGRLEVIVTAIEGSKVEILIGDDGKGLDTAGILAAAVRSGVVTSEDVSRMSPQQAQALTIRSGVSTSPTVTDISGHGLGMAIAQEKVDKLGGTLAMESTPGQGTRVRLTLPLTLAAFNGLLVSARGSLFVLPATAVMRAVRVKRDQIKRVEGHETLVVDGEVLALRSLAELLDLADSEAADLQGELAFAVVITAAGRRLACEVDEVLGIHEVVVKGLGPQLERVPNIAAATVLASGRVVPIINVSDLVQANPSERRRRPPTQPPAPHRVLVAEDSVTARSLLKNILQTAGYEVATAVDGLDAFEQLRAQRYDAVVSDIEMPRLGGFELTAKVRGDSNLRDTPVVLVTSLDSPSDRERGIEVGADAYLVKSSFEQSNLLATLARLL